MTQESRLDRLENKLDTLQAQGYHNHLELLGVLSKRNEEVDDEINVINLRLKEHDGHFGLVAKLLSGGSIIGAWLGLRDFWPHK